MAHTCIKYHDMKFDLISDLHLDQWSTNIKDWRGLGTSLTCVVAGDVSKDLRLATSFLKHLCGCYKQVIYVDGNHENHGSYHDIPGRQQQIDDMTASIENLTYLADSACVIEGTAFIGTNGWWTFDYAALNNLGSKLDAMDHFCRKEKHSMRDAMHIWTAANEQASFLCDVTATLQDNDDVHEIVVVTHTVPRHDLIFPRKYDINDHGKMGNSSMLDVLRYDINGKISTWCFGHYHGYNLDVMKDGVRYVSHMRGRPSDALTTTYYPLLVDTVPVKLDVKG